MYGNAAPYPLPQGPLGTYHPQLLRQRRVRGSEVGCLLVWVGHRLHTQLWDGNLEPVLDVPRPQHLHLLQEVKRKGRLVLGDQATLKTWSLDPPASKNFTFSKSPCMSPFLQLCNNGLAFQVPPLWAPINSPVPISLSKNTHPSLGTITGRAARLLGCPHYPYPMHSCSIPSHILARLVYEQQDMNECWSLPS